MPNLTDAYNAIIAACNDPYIGYSMDPVERRSITLGVNYRTYCDCSSLISWGLTQGGFFLNNPWFATASEVGYLTGAGFVEVDIAGLWQAGDVLWHPKGGRWSVGHTEMVYAAGPAGKGYTMGAHWAKPNFADQVSINTSLSSKYDYTKLFRYDGVSPPDPGQPGDDPDDPGDPGKRDIPTGAIIEELRRRLWYPGRH